MAYLIASDYLSQIQDVSLQQVISGKPAYRSSVEQKAQAEISSYLRQKYDILKEFTNTLLYDPTKTYSAADRVYLDAAAYNPAATYIIGQLTLQQGIVYTCTVAINAPEAFNAAHWSQLGAQYDMFFANYPYSPFDIYGDYRRGDQVWYKNHIYTCLQDTRRYSHADYIQFHDMSNIPLKNYFPDDPINGATHWRDNGVYFVPAGNLLTQADGPTVKVFEAREDMVLVAGATAGFPAGATGYTNSTLNGWTYSLERRAKGTQTQGVEYTTTDDSWHLTDGQDIIQDGEIFILHFLPVVDEPAPEPQPSSLTVSQLVMTYFTKGDNRDQQLLMYYLDISIYHLYSRIAPKNIPEERAGRYTVAISTLRMAARGEIDVNLPKLQPKQGQMIRSGGNIKNINSY